VHSDHDIVFVGDLRSYHMTHVEDIANTVTKHQDQQQQQQWQQQKQYQQEQQQQQQQQ